MISIGIADAHGLTRLGIKSITASEVDLRVVGEAQSATLAIALAQQLRPKVLILDLGTSPQSGLISLAAIRSSTPETSVLVFTGLAQEYYAAASIEAGAAGYISKNCQPAELLEAIRATGQGRRYIPAAIGEELAVRLVRGGTHASPHELLSPREFQVFILLAGGRTATRIANELKISTKSVTTFRQRAMKKLQLASNSDLTYYAMKKKLLD